MQRKLFVFCLIHYSFFAHFAQGFKINNPSTYDNAKSSQTHQDYQEATISIRKRRSVDEISINTRYNDNDIEINLQPTDSLFADTRTRVWVAKRKYSHRDEFEYTLQKNIMKEVNISFYHDRETSSSVSYYMNQDGKQEFNGIIDQDKVLYQLPINQRNRRNLLSKLFSQSDESVHKNYYRIKKRSTFSNVQYEDNDFTDSHSSDMEKSELGMPDIVYPELLIVFDKTLFKQFNYNVVQAVAYILTFWNTVDLYYRDMEYPKIRLNIAGIVLCQDQIVPMKRFKIDHDLLVGFAEFLYTQSAFKVKKDYDIAILMGGNSEFHGGRTGKAYVAAACSKSEKKEKVRSTGIVLDNADFRGIKTASHELGHLLGAPHDGDESKSFLGGPGAESCPFQDGYRMSTRKINNNQFYFSSCSKKIISFYLSRENADCLRNNPALERTDELMPRMLPGIYMSLDDQCKLKGYAGAASKIDERVCSGILCYSESKNRYHSTDVPALAGSPCGHGKYCFKGDCVKVKDKLPNILGPKTEQPQPSLIDLNKSSDEQCKEMGYDFTSSATVDCVVYCINYKVRGQRVSYRYKLSYAQDGTSCGINSFCQKRTCVNNEENTISDTNIPPLVTSDQKEQSVNENNKLVDEQCKKSGSVSKVIISGCVIFCSDNNGTNSIVTDTDASDGFPCNDKGVCNNGKCVNNSETIPSSTNPSIETPNGTPFTMPASTTPTNKDIETPIVTVSDKKTYFNQMCKAGGTLGLYNFSDDNECMIYCKINMNVSEWDTYNENKSNEDDGNAHIEYFIPDRYPCTKDGICINEKCVKNNTQSSIDSIGSQRVSRSINVNKQQYNISRSTHESFVDLMVPDGYP